MIITFLFYYFLLSLAFIFTLNLLLQNKKFKNIPPGPPSLPILGNLHQLKKPLHHTFQRISQRYGQIVSLWFGSRLVVVVSSPSAVQECFTKNDIVLANRPRFLVGEYVSYSCSIRALVPLNKFLEMQRDEMKRLVRKLGQVSYKEFAKVEMKSRFSEMTFNVHYNENDFGQKVFGDDGEVGEVQEARKFREMIKELVTLGGANNPADFLPILRWFNYDHLERRLKSFAKRIDGFLQGLIDEFEIQSRGQIL